MRQKIECSECGQEFTITYTGKETIGYCPICGEMLVTNQLDEKENWDEEDEEDYEYEDDTDKGEW